MENRAQRMESIKEIVSDILEIEPEEMTDESLFKEDHDADSLRAIEILAALEKEFDVEIPQEQLGQMSCLNAVYSVVGSAAKWVN